MHSLFVIAAGASWVDVALAIVAMLQTVVLAALAIWARSQHGYTRALLGNPRK